MHSREFDEVNAEYSHGKTLVSDSPSRSRANELATPSTEQHVGLHVHFIESNLNLTREEKRAADIHKT